MEFRFNVGDKVKIKEGIKFHKYENGRCVLSVPAEITRYENKELTIEKIGGRGRCRYNFPVYCLREDKRSNCGMGYTWAEEWLEPVGEFRAFISFSAQNREEAFQKAKEEIEKVFGPKDWTPDEISAAQAKVIFLASKVVSEGGDVNFIKSGESILCNVYKSSFCPDTKSFGIATPKGQDVPNDWIGKCVALCSALHESIPFFISNKNK